MSRPSDDLPTTVIPQQTAEQPPMATAPATQRSRIWPRRLPARIGRARTSTVIIGALFLLLGGLNVVLPQDPYVTVPTQYGDLRVRQSQLTVTPSTTPAPTDAPAETDEPATPTTTPATTSRAPETTTDEDEEPATTAPRTPLSPTDEETGEETDDAPATTSSRATPSRAPSTTAEDDEEPAGTTSSTG